MEKRVGERGRCRDKQTLALKEKQSDENFNNWPLFDGRELLEWPIK